MKFAWNTFMALAGTGLALTLGPPAVVKTNTLQMEIGDPERKGEQAELSDWYNS